MRRQYWIRAFDVLLSLFILLAVSPFVVIASLLVGFTSAGPVLFIQRRVGRYGSEYEMYKFRTMYLNNHPVLLTVGKRDPRLTPAGAFLKKIKFDEVPQLFNVLKGDMSLVGPRPEVKKYTDTYTLSEKRILEVKPGITDIASLLLWNEDEILANVACPEQFYLSVLKPVKIRISSVYAQQPSLKRYAAILALTLLRFTGLQSKRLTQLKVSFDAWIDQKLISFGKNNIHTEKINNTKPTFRFVVNKPLS